jgi:chromosome segregation ATPase
LTRLLLVVIIGAVAGCVSSDPPSRPPVPIARPQVTLLARADGLAADGQYADALHAYGEIVTKFPDTEEAGRARRSRETLNDLLAARAQIGRLSAEIKAQEAQMKVHEAELARARGEISARDGELVKARQEIARLTAEADRLRVDLENLKKIDIDLERRRK